MQKNKTIQLLIDSVKTNCRERSPYCFHTFSYLIVICSAVTPRPWLGMWFYRLTTGIIFAYRGMNEAL